jgi:hypothetical protein
MMAASLPALAFRFAPVELPLPEGRVVVAVLDADGDEALDLAVFSVAGAPPVLLTQAPQTGWQSVPLGAGAVADDEPLAVLAADVNHDLHTDLIVSRANGISVLLHDGKRGFEASARLEGAESFGAVAASLSAGDVNDDGRLDILETRNDGQRGAVRLWLSEPASKGGTPAWRLTRPLGDAPCCVPATALLADLDGDGFLDLLVAHRAGALEIFSGRGGNEARFEKRAHDIAGEWAHVDAGDVDNDGDLDLLLSGANNTAPLHMNDGAFRFRRLDDALPAVTSPGVSPRFADFDSDGRLDIAWSAGVILQQQDGMRFRAVSVSEAPSALLQGGYTVADINGDGYPDFLSSGPGVKPHALVQHPGGHHWLLVRLRGDAGRDVAGARITAKTPDGRKTVRHLLLGDTVASSHAEGVLLGISRHTQVNTLEVHWLSRRYTRLDEPLVKRPIGFIEPPAGAPRQVSLSNPVLEHLLSRKPAQRPQVCRPNYRPPGSDVKSRRKESVPAKPAAP